MTLRPLLAVAQRMLAWLVLLVSGAYLLIYLYRWEWNRAIVSGLFFIAAEVALATSMLLRRIQALEARGSAPAADPLVLERLRATPVAKPNPFDWLKPHANRLEVFVPVLLGAGAILSALAYVFERIAQATAVPAVDRGLASRLAALAPPRGGLVGPAPVRADPVREPSPTAIGRTALAVIALVVVGWLGIDALLDATESRPEPLDRPASTAIELAIAQHEPAPSAAQAAEALWISCRSTLGAQQVATHVVPLEGDRVRLVLEPGIGKLSTRRLTGCLADFQIDLVRADVVDVVTRP